MSHGIRAVGSPSEYTIALPSALQQHLTLLTEALAQPGTDLQAILAVLSDDLTDAFPSFLGLTISLTTGGHPTIVSTVGPVGGPSADSSPAAGGGVPVAASLQLPLAPISDAEPGSTLRFYASAPGVFVDLAADARRTYGLDGDVVVDGHLQVPPQEWSPALSGATDIHQAIGVLFALGHPDPTAELDAQATRLGLTRHQVAQRVLAGLDGPADPADRRPGQPPT